MVVTRQLSVASAALEQAPLLAARAAHDPRLRPEYLFARSARRGRTPVVVVVRRHDIPIGVVYAIEELIARIPSGALFLGDRCGAGLLVALPADRDLVLRAGLERLVSVPRVHTLVLNYPRPHSPADTDGNGVPAALHALPTASVHAGDYNLPNRLPLAASWPAFLDSLGPDTRRNMRRYPRRATETGMQYVPDLAPQEFRAAFESLRRHANRWDHVDPTLALAGSADSLRVGLRSADGQWVSVLCGWRHGERAFALTQLNDARSPRASLSMVLRAALIEDLIRRGVRELVFLDGCAGALKVTCRPEPVRRALVDVRTARGRLAESIVSRIWPRLAERLWTGRPQDLARAMATFRGSTMQPPSRASA